MIGKAHKMGLLTTPYAFNQEEAVEMAKAGADIIVAHMGLTTSGTIGAKTAVSLEESVVRVQQIADAAHRINRNAIVLCHGGMILQNQITFPLRQLYHDRLYNQIIFQVLDPVLKRRNSY